jgi:putative Holliday junction resolvase
MRRSKRFLAWSKLPSGGKLMGSRILALDHGTKRIGVALSDELGWTAQPLETFERRTLDRDIAHILDLVRSHDVGQVLLGLPLRLNGGEGPAVQAVHEFAARLGEVLPVPLVTWDERMTTKAAEDLLIAADVSRKKRKGAVDRVAAAILLQGYLEAQASGLARPVSGSAGEHAAEEGRSRAESDQSHDATSDHRRARPRHRSRRSGRVSDDSVG